MGVRWHIETDFFALAVFIALLIKSLWIRRERSFQDRAFVAIMALSIFSTVTDIFASVAMNAMTNWWFYQITMILYALTVPVMAFLWIVYTLLLIFPKEDRRTGRLIALLLVPYLVYFGVCVSNPWTGWMFTLGADFAYARGPLFMPMGVGEDMLYTALGLLLLALFHKRIRPRFNIVLLAVFFVSTAASLWVQMAHPGWLIIYATYAVVYVICDATIEEQRRKAMYDTIQEQNVSLERALAEYEEASKAKSRFLSRMSHDIRTPINGIMGMATLAADNENPPDTSACLAKIQTSCDFLLGLVNDTLDMTKVESGKVELHPEPYPFAQFQEYIQSIILPMCRQKGVELVQEYQPIPGDSWVPMMDKLRVNQIFFNLLSNAVKFTPEGGTVTLKLRTEKTAEKRIALLVEVSDTGIGISKEFQKHMFESFTQEEQTLLPQRQGSGLGLSIVKAMLELMNGTITVDSELGKGSAFHVRAEFDIVKASELTGRAGAKKTKTRLSDLDGQNILLAEDHPLNQEIAVRLLKKAGMNVVAVENGKLAAEAYAASPKSYYAAVLMDIRMPVMDGMETARQIRALPRADAKRVPIIAMTANAFEDDVRACLDAGMNEHLSKPIVPATLYQTLAKYLSDDRDENVKVLVVDDEEINAAVVVSALESDYRVVTAANGEQALRALEEEGDVAAVITDIQMPVMNGVELIRRMRANAAYDGVVIIANTQYGEAEQEDELLRLGANDFIYKPTHPLLLITRLRNLLLCKGADTERRN